MTPLENFPPGKNPVVLVRGPEGDEHIVTESMADHFIQTMGYEIVARGPVNPARALKGLRRRKVTTPKVKMPKVGEKLL